MSTPETNPTEEAPAEAAAPESAVPTEGALPGDDTEKGPGLEKAKPASVSEEHLKSILESLIFVSNSPVPARKLARIAKAPVADVRELLENLAEDYEPRGIQLIELASGWQFRSAAVNAPFVRDIVAKRPVRLTRAQLETLSIAAYRQPLTKPELEEIRGVDSSSALKVLLDRGLLKILGRKDEPGRPLLYGTTPFFLEFFGLKSLDELPTLKEFSELSDESKALFARKTGEDIESIGEIEVEAREYDESEFEDRPEEDESEDDEDDEDRDEDELDDEGSDDDDEDSDDEDDDSDDDDDEDSDDDDDDSDDDDVDDDDEDSDDDDDDDDDSDDDDDDSDDDDEDSDADDEDSDDDDEDWDEEE